jgi:hypothetical protein
MIALLNQVTHENPGLDQASLSELKSDALKANGYTLEEANLHLGIDPIPPSAAAGR